MAIEIEGSGSGNRTRGAAVWPCHNTTHHAVTHHPSPVAHPHQHLRRRRRRRRQRWRWARGHCAPEPVCFFVLPNRYENSTKTKIIIVDLNGHHHHYHHLPPVACRPSPIANRPQHQHQRRRRRWKHTATVAWPCGRATTSTTHHHANYDHPVTRHPSPVARAHRPQQPLQNKPTVLQRCLQNRGFMYIPMHFHDKPVPFPVRVQC